MALTITKKKEDIETAEADTLPDDDIVIEQKPDRERELELELAEKRGELKALKTNASATTNQPLSIDQTKQLVLQDSNALDDAAFFNKYKNTKHAAMMIVMDEDNRQTKKEARRDRAEATAVVEIASEIGSDFYRFKDRILENANDLSEEARQDPAKLKRWMKSQYLTMTQDMERPLTKKDVSRRQIAKDFEPPVIEVRDRTNEMNTNDEIKDEIPAESDISNKKLAGFMGLHSEKERKQFAATDVIYVDTDLGDGWRHTKEGFRRAVKQSA